MNVAIIPARSGSKRLKGKNIKIFKNKPVIYWSILAAKKTRLFDKIIVSTNSFKIAKISNKFGAETPFIRAKELANDKTSTISVIKNEILTNNNIKIIRPGYGLKPENLSKVLNKKFKKQYKVGTPLTFQMLK